MLSILGFVNLSTKSRACSKSLFPSILFNFLGLLCPFQYSILVLHVLHCFQLGRAFDFPTSDPQPNRISAHLAHIGTQAVPASWAYETSHHLGTAFWSLDLTYFVSTVLRINFFTVQKKFKRIPDYFDSIAVFIP